MLLCELSGSHCSTGVDVHTRCASLAWRPTVSFLSGDCELLPIECHCGEKFCHLGPGLLVESVAENPLDRGSAPDESPIRVCDDALGSLFLDLLECRGVARFDMTGWYST